MIQMTYKPITYIDLFSGCGGMSEGFQMSKSFEGLAHIDYELPMVNVLRNRLQSKYGYSEHESLKKVIHMDISATKLLFGGFKNSTREMDKVQQKFLETNSNDFLEGGLHQIIGRRQVQVIIGGPSCQAYSIAGRAQSPDGMKSDPRNYLFESFVDIVDALKPNVFVFENVPGMLSAKPNGIIPITMLIRQAFEKINYLIHEDLSEVVFDMSQYGLPQKRKRLIIFGVKKDGNHNLYDFYSKLKNRSNSKNTVSVYDSIGHLPKLKPKSSFGQSYSHEYQTGEIQIPFHEPRFHSERDQEIFYQWIEGKWNKQSAEKKLQFYLSHQGIKRKSLIGAKINKYRNLEWDKPSPTIVAHLKKDGLLFIHPDKEQRRTLTVKECALLQGFPEDYKFSPYPGWNYQMIGNAVPPTFARILADVIADVLKEN